MGDLGDYGEGGAAPPPLQTFTEGDENFDSLRNREVRGAQERFRSFLRHEALQLHDDGSITFGGTEISEGAQNRRILRGFQSGVVSGGDADGIVTVTFGQSFVNVPHVELEAQQIEVPPSGDKLRLYPKDIQTGEFTLVAQKYSPGTISEEEDDFPSGNSLTATGANTDASLSPGGAEDDSYTVHYSVSVTANTATEFLNTVETEVSILGSTDGGATFPHTLDTFIYGVTADDQGSQTKTWSHEKKPVNKASLDVVRLEVTDETIGSDGGSYDIHGFNLPTDGDAEHGVTYQTDSGPTTNSAIPDSGDKVKWAAYEKA